MAGTGGNIGNVAPTDISNTPIDPSTQVAPADATPDPVPATIDGSDGTAQEAVIGDGGVQELDPQKSPGETDDGDDS